MIDVASVGARAHTMLDALAACSDDQGRLTRLSFGPAHRRAADLVLEWMAEAGLSASIDAVGTVRGIRRSSIPGGRSLLLGSHIDTVPDAGRFDGMLGVVVAILAIARLRTQDLPFNVEVLAFGDEEGLRFPSATIGSSALVEPLLGEQLQSHDADGVRLGDAIAAFRGLAPEPLDELPLDPQGLVGYLEVHIEQGPVLHALGAPLGVVTSIAAACRLRITLTGSGGHAGTVPMQLRHDALTGAAELVLAVEGIARQAGTDLVATVGELRIRDAAANAIPREVEFTIDVRAASDPALLEALVALRRALYNGSRRRGLELDIITTYEERATPCDPYLAAVVAAAVADLDLTVPRLASGAGHDAQAMARITLMAMLFVRCTDGISHDPAEYATPHDVGLAVAALIGAVERLASNERADSGAPTSEGRR